MLRCALAAICLLLSTLVAACSGAQRGAPVEGGCPSAMQVGFAQWARPALPGRSKPDPSWLVRLGYREPGESAPGPGPLPAYEVAKLGLGPLPPTVWVMQAGVPTCPATVTGYVAELADHGVTSLMISAVLAGCPAGAEANAPAWISLAGREPLGCEVRPPVADSARYGIETEPGFAVEPTTATLPTVWQPFAPAELCESPCETLWSVATVAGNPSVHAVAIADVIPGPDACDLEGRETYGLYATTPDGVAHLLRGPEREDFGDPELSRTTLAGTLVDPRGTRALLAIGIDDWSAYDLGADGILGAGRTVRFFEANQEDTLHLSLLPYCGP